MKNKSNIPQKEVSQIISERLKLQSTQRALENRFGLFIPSLMSLRSVIDTFSALSKENQSDFIIILGGKVNYNKTANYLSDLAKIYGTSLEIPA